MNYIKLLVVLKRPSSEEFTFWKFLKTFLEIFKHVCACLSVVYVQFLTPSLETIP